MFNGNAMPSLADIAAVTGNGRNNDGMWGGDGWWAIIIPSHKLDLLFPALYNPKNVFQYIPVP